MKASQFGRYAVLLALAVAVNGTAVAADPLADKVTGRRNGKEQSYKDGQDTIGLGLAVAVFGSALLEFQATKERWEAAQKTDHIRIRFAKRTALTAVTWGQQGKRYEVDEFLIKTTPWDKRPPLPTPNGRGYFEAGDNSHWGKEDSLLVRCGDKYFSLAKSSGMLTQPLIALFGPAPEVKD